MDPEFTGRFLEDVRATPAADPEGILHRLYAALVEGNYEVCGESMTDDVELNIAGFEPMDGNWRGRTAVIAAAQHNYSIVSNQKPVIESMISEGGRIGVLMRETGVLKSSGQSYAIRAVQWFTLSDGSQTNRPDRRQNYCIASNSAWAVHTQRLVWSSRSPNGVRLWVNDSN
jgi:ketosteroid isomerase-like protein